MHSDKSYTHQLHLYDLIIVWDYVNPNYQLGTMYTIISSINNTALLQEVPEEYKFVCQ